MREPKLYRKKPVAVEVMQFQGETNISNVVMWMEDYNVSPIVYATDESLGIPTLEGEMLAGQLDYIVCGVQGEFYPVKPHIFEATYEEARDD